jgi:hypothetical protein
MARNLFISKRQTRLPGNQQSDLVRKGLGERQGLLNLLARDQAHGLVDETIPLAPHLVEEGNLTLVLGTKCELAEMHDGAVLFWAARAKPFVQHQCPSSLKHGVVDDVEGPIQVIR